jgi:catechol 2,3-dioxygenase-like lactoylglutathione lyase family enzyme
MTRAIPRLEHAFLTVRDLERSLRFYRTLLPEWEIRWEGTSRRGQRWVHFGDPRGAAGSYLSLHEMGSAKKSLDVPYEYVRIEHLGVAHADVSEVVRRAREAGLHPTDEVDADGFRRAYFQDPDGIELEFVQPQ